MTVRLIQGNALDELRKLPAESVHCIVTSPPYLGLRSYRIEPVTWPDGWTGHLGLEPSIDLFVQHLVSIFREVKRVLHPSGTCWVNLGDSYASGKGTCNNPGGGTSSLEGHAILKDSSAYPLDRGNKSDLEAQGLKPLDLCGIPERFALAMQQDGWYWRDRVAWVKNSPMPESVSGWTWQKCKVKTKSGSIASGTLAEGKFHGQAMNDVAANGLTAQWADCSGCDKCKDTGGYVLRKGSWRTTRAWEYIFMFAKTPDYFACQEQVREPQTGNAHSRGTENGTDAYYEARGSYKGFNSPMTELPAGRNPRSWWLINSEPALWDFCLACGTWFGKGGWNRKSVKRWSETETEDDEPKTVHHAKCPNCQAVDQFVAHYALFPTELPKRCIQAATSDAGVCLTCGSQWAPAVERQSGRIRGGDYQSETRGHEASARVREDGSSKVLSYRATCTCPAHKPIPATVLDPFSGGASSGLAADRLGRSYIGIELSESYLKLSKARLQADGPMMAGMEE